MKKGGRFRGVFESVYYCSHAHLEIDVTIALNNKELHKKYSIVKYYGMEHPCDMRHWRCNQISSRTGNSLRYFFRNSSSIRAEMTVSSFTCASAMISPSGLIICELPV